MKKNKTIHQWHFIQNGGLIQAQISTIDDVLNLKDLDPKLWTALACPTNGLEFSEETLNLLDIDKNGRVRQPEILLAIDFIKKYFAKPEIIMTAGDTVPIDAISETPFANGNIPIEAAKEILAAIGKTDAKEIGLADLSAAVEVFSKKAAADQDIIKSECINNPDAANAYLKVKEKIDDYFLKCSVIKYDNAAKDIIKAQADALFAEGNLSDMPLSACDADKTLILDDSINPAWQGAINNFRTLVFDKLYEDQQGNLSEENWKAIEAEFSGYEDWCNSSPDNSLIQSCSDLKKLVLYRRDFITLLKNFVSFEDFYSLDNKSIFQAGTLFIDGRSCDLCFKVTDIAKHGIMAALSQCFLIYCDCADKTGDKKMQIAALISNGNTDNLLVGRNGMFVDRNGKDWDATIVKIIDNPVSIKQAFWAPYKKLMRMIQEKIAKTTNDAEANMMKKMTAAVDNPKSISASSVPAKKTDIGTVAAISVAFTGIATVVGGILQAFLGLGWWIPLGIAGIILAISLPSMLIAWRKLKQRNIAPILDANGWAINGNVKITPVLGATLTHLPERPASAFLSKKDVFAEKKFNWKLFFTIVIIIAILVAAALLIIKTPDGISGVWENIKTIFSKFKFVKN